MQYSSKCTCDQHTLLNKISDLREEKKHGGTFELQYVLTVPTRALQVSHIISLRILGVSK